MDGMIMQTNTQRRTNGYTGLTVLALFAVAIIAGQARGDLRGSYPSDADLPTALELGVLIEQKASAGIERKHESIRKFRTMPAMIDFGTDILDIAEGVSNRSTGRETIL